MMVFIILLLLFSIVWNVYKLKMKFFPVFKILAKEDMFICDSFSEKF